MEIMTAFGEQMRRVMAERGMSLHKLAKIVNYDVGYLCKVRNGQKPASPVMAARVDNALGAGGALIALAPAPPVNPRHRGGGPVQADYPPPPRAALPPRPPAKCHPPPPPNS